MTVIILLVQQKVLWLDVTVANSIGVQVTQGVEGLFHY